MNQRPTFDASVEETLAECTAICSQRGGEYLDTWDLENLIATFTRATLSAMGVKLTSEELRLVMCAALVDVKDSRMIGPFKTDTIVDGINYRAAYSSLRRKYEEGKKEMPPPAPSPLQQLGEFIPVDVFPASNGTTRV
jgi:hypothetical protein